MYYERNTTNDIVMLICSCLFISFIHGGIWLLVPFLNGTIAFAISLFISGFCIISTDTRINFFRELHGSGIVILLLLAAVYSIGNGEKLIGSQFLNAFFCFTLMQIAAYMYFRPYLRKSLLKFIALELLISLVASMYFLIKDPYLIRQANFDNLVTTGEGLQKLVSSYKLYEYA